MVWQAGFYAGFSVYLEEKFIKNGVRDWTESFKNRMN